MVDKVSSIYVGLNQMKQKTDREVNSMLNRKPPKGLELNPTLKKSLEVMYSDGKPLSRSICGSPIVFKDYKQSIQKKKQEMKR
jgi:hypothetical protein